MTEWTLARNWEFARWLEPDSLKTEYRKDHHHWPSAHAHGTCQMPQTSLLVTFYFPCKVSAQGHTLLDKNSKLESSEPRPPLLYQSSGALVDLWGLLYQGFFSPRMLGMAWAGMGEQYQRQSMLDSHGALKTRREGSRNISSTSAPWQLICSATIANDWLAVNYQISILNQP